MINEATTTYYILRLMPQVFTDPEACELKYLELPLQASMAIALEPSLTLSAGTLVELQNWINVKCLWFFVFFKTLIWSFDKVIGLQLQQWEKHTANMILNKVLALFSDSDHFSELRRAAGSVSTPHSLGFLSTCYLRLSLDQGHTVHVLNLNYSL